MSLRVVFAVVVVLTISMLLASSLLGLGDAEALYYCYGQNLSLSYLDHPPLIGWMVWLSTLIGGSTVFAVRAVSWLLAVLSLVFTYLLTRDLFGHRAGAWSALLLLGTPVFSVGMIAATPDAPLVALWPLITWQLHRALVDDRRGAWQRLFRPLLIGLLIGLAFLAKYTGVCLVLTVFVAASHGRGRIWLKRPGFWLAAILALIVVLPVFIWNAQNGWAGLAHRLVWTQESAGLSLRNAGALLGGQLLYVGPLMLPLLIWSGIYIWHKRHENPDRLVLLAASIPALVLTYLLVLWSDVAEPHWPAAGYIPLFVAAAGLVVEIEGRARTLARFAFGFGCAVLLGAHVLILSPLLPALTPEESYRPEYDLGNELRGWPEVADTVRALNRDGRPVFAGFYTQCSQLTFALSRPFDPKVRCVSKETDDFDIWHKELVMPTGAIFVTDNRFDFHPEKLVSKARVRGSPVIVEITRGGRWVRRFQIFDLERR